MAGLPPRPQQGNEAAEQEDQGGTPEMPTDAGGLSIHDGKFKRYCFYGVIFEVPTKYVPIVPIGRGAYGIVCQAKNTATGEEVAIKKIGNAFADKTDAKRTLREIVLLRNMRHPNVIAFKDLVRPPNPRNFKDVYLVYELMPTDLHEVIHWGQAMDERHYKFILYQLLKGTKYIHSANVIHRDLKPPNILIDARCNVKITDFGLARTRVGMENDLTKYVVTRYYRAPELLVSNANYTTAVDVWSLGLIYLELVLGHIVLKGETYVDQLRKTCELLGSPGPEDVTFITKESARNFIRDEIPAFPRRPLREIFPKLSPEGADLTEKMLAFDPRRRITVDDALKHPYLAHYYKPEQILLNTTPFQYDLSFEQEEYDIPRIRQLIYEESCTHSPKG